MNLVKFSLFLMIALQALSVIIEDNVIVATAGIFMASMLLFAAGIFSDRWYCWAGIVFSILVFLTTMFEMPSPFIIWLRISIFMTGFVVLQFLMPKKSTFFTCFFRSLILSLIVLAGAFLGQLLHVFVFKSPGELSVYQLTDEKPTGRFILNLSKGADLTGVLSIDRFTIKPMENMPTISVKVTKRLELVFEGNEYKNLFRVAGKNWENREPFQSYRRLSYVHVTTQDGLKFDLFLPYFTGKHCECIELVE